MGRDQGQGGVGSNVSKEVRVEQGYGMMLAYWAGVAKEIEQFNRQSKGVTNEYGTRKKAEISGAGASERAHGGGRGGDCR